MSAKEVLLHRHKLTFPVKRYPLHHGVSSTHDCPFTNASNDTVGCDHFGIYENGQKGTAHHMHKSISLYVCDHNIQRSAPVYPTILP